ncbi:MAG: DoxX family protein [Bacteroidetes bacterium]|nr:DoxX family protein [Bacteroidota bacterium]
MTTKQQNLRRLFITLLRVAIGWHFLYEGLSKITAGNWTASGYLMNTTGFMSGFYHWIAGNSALLQISDLLNMYGLLFIGLSLFIGIFIRYAAIAGTLLLTLYYFAYPPFGTNLFGASEGHLYIVDKIFIEAAALIFLFFYNDKGYSIDNLIPLFRQKSTEPESEKKSSGNLLTQRGVEEPCHSACSGINGLGSIPQPES